MRKIITNSFFVILSATSFSQIKWKNVDSLYQPLPSSVHIYLTDQPIDTGAFRAFYLIADLKDKKLEFTTDTSLNRRLTPAKFFERHKKPLVVVNCTFFSFETNRNLNLVIKNGKLTGYNVHTVVGRGKDTFTYKHAFASGIGINKKRKADVAWTYTDTSKRSSFAIQESRAPLHDSIPHLPFSSVRSIKYSVLHGKHFRRTFHKWKMQTAVGGGPVLLQNGEITIANEEELKFTGKAINDKHPRTAMGYTKEGKLIILMIEGRNNAAHGATLRQEAEILKALGCVEALNLDGGGSSCMLVNGKETIKPSDKEGQRPVPAVFVIKQK